MNAKNPPKSKTELRREREARALRENLKRRKAQSAARREAAANPPEDKSASET